MVKLMLKYYILITVIFFKCPNFYGISVVQTDYRWSRQTNVSIKWNQFWLLKAPPILIEWRWNFGLYRWNISNLQHEYITKSGLPQSGKNIWKMTSFQGQGKVREFCGWSGKYRKYLECQGKVREFENNWLWQAVFKKFILFKRG